MFKWRGHNYMWNVSWFTAQGWRTAVLAFSLQPVAVYVSRNRPYGTAVTFKTWKDHPRIWNQIYKVSRGGECARLRENVPYVKVHRSNPKYLYLKLNGYGDNGERKVWSSCGSTYCTRFACCYQYTVHVRPSVSQPSQALSAFIINGCHSYSEL